MDDLTPLPAKEQEKREKAARRARSRVLRREKWLQGRDRRQRAYRSFKAAGRRALTLAISVLGATLVGYGVWMIYAPAGFIVGGLVLWILQWNYGSKGSDG